MIRMNLPLLLDAKDAVEHYKNTPSCPGPVIAQIVAILSKDGFTNKEIREALNIDKVYLVTHYKRVGTSLTEEELELWLNNPNRITFGHVRAIAILPYEVRLKMLQDHLAKKRKSVAMFESEAKALSTGKPVQKTIEIKQFEEKMQETTGRVLNIKYNQAKQSGSITINFYSIDGLEDIAQSLGFNPADHL